MLKTLLKRQLSEIFRSYFYDAKKNRARSKAATVAYFILFALLIAVVLGGMFTFLALVLCRTFCEAGLGWLYFALFSLLALALGTFGSVFNTYSGLYLSRDNDLLLSMPIPVSHLIAARLLGVYLMGLLYSAVVLLPAIIVYWCIAAPAVGAVLGALLLTVLISLMVLVLTCLLGWVVAKISRRLKNKSLITVLVSLLGLGIYYFVYFKLQTLLQDLLANAVRYGAAVRSSAYPLYLLGRIGEGDGLAMLLFTLGTALALALTWLLLSRSFLGLAAATDAPTRRARRAAAARLRSPARALLAKEFRRFFSSPNYILNCGLGTLFLTALGVVLLLRGNALAAALRDLALPADSLSPLLCAAVCLVAAMNDSAAPSVSLEGKSLWLLQSLPIDPWLPLRAKLHVQLWLTLPPALFCGACGWFVFRFPLIEGILTLAAIAVFCLLCAAFGLTIGLSRANTAWTSELVPLKQDFGVMLALLVGWGVALLLGIGYLLLADRLSPALYLTAALPLLLIPTLPLTHRLRHATRLAELG